MLFGNIFNQSVDNVAWPPQLKRLTFGLLFFQPIVDVAWLSSLEEISFGVTISARWSRGSCGRHRSSDWCLGRILNNGSDESCGLNHYSKVTFGFNFKQALRGVPRLASVQQLTLSPAFIRAVNGSVLPASLREFTFGAMFNRPVDGLVLPASLVAKRSMGSCGRYHYVQQLAFGVRFDQPIDGVELPDDTLQQLTLGLK